MNGWDRKTQHAQFVKEGSTWDAAKINVIHVTSNFLKKNWNGKNLNNHFWTPKLLRNQRSLHLNLSSAIIVSTLPEFWERSSAEAANGNFSKIKKTRSWVLWSWRSVTAANCINWNQEKTSVLTVWKVWKIHIGAKVVSKISLVRKTTVGSVWHVGAKTAPNVLNPSRHRETIVCFVWSNVPTVESATSNQPNKCVQVVRLHLMESYKDLDLRLKQRKWQHHHRKQTLWCVPNVNIVGRP